MGGGLDGDDDDDFEEREFAPAERRRLRKQMEEWERCHWAWKGVLRGVMYSIGVVTALYALREPILRAIKAVFGGQP